jgi:peptidoglycan/LPS O-acetylase OafA/YrhL
MDFNNTKKSSSKFLPALESSRGIAALLVIIFHYGTSTGGENLRHISRNFYLPVDLFFILSGFIMAKIYFDKIKKSGDLAKFLVLRLGRIYPLHLFWIIVFLAMFLILQQGRLTPEQVNVFWPTLFLVHPDDTMFNGPSWSISAEWITYCLFGVHIFLVEKIPEKINTVIVALICFMAYFLFYIPTPNQSQITSGFLRSIGGFYLGILGYLYLKKYRLPKFAGYIFWIMGFYLFIHQDIKDTSTAYLFPLMAIIGVLWLAESQTQKSWLSHPSLVWLGTVSYSVYLGHTFVGLFINKIFERTITLPATQYQFYGLLVFKLISSYCVAYLTHKFIENPFRKLAKNWVGRWS